jgi:phenylalanine ammonia-lyase
MSKTNPVSDKGEVWPRASSPGDVRRRTKGLQDIVKRTSHCDFVFACADEMHRARSITLDGDTLNVPQVVAVARGGAEASLTKSEKIRGRVASSVDWLTQRLAEGANFYGITEGFGGSSDLRTKNTEALQAELIRFLNVGFGESLPEEIVRAAMLIRVNSNLVGYSSIRWECLEHLVTMINKGITPVVPRRGSLTASGDLVPLAHIVGVLIGSESARARYQGKEITAREALSIAGLKPIELRAKEGLALVNGTSVANGAAALSMYEANLLGLLAQVCTALSVEVLLGSDQSYDPVIHSIKPHPGQKETACNLLHLLEGSRLARKERETDIASGGIRQDRYSLRTAPQWLGPQLEVLLESTERVTTEANSVTDNPVIDAENGRALHGGNFQGTAITVAMEHTRLALEAIGQLLFAQFGQMVNGALNNGLPPNLAGASDLATDMGLKGAEIVMASLKSELEFLASPVQTHVKSAELHNQDINSLGLISAMYTRDAVLLLQKMTAHHLYASMQAVDLRNVELALLDAGEQAIANALQKAGLIGAAGTSEDEGRLKRWLMDRFRSQMPLCVTANSDPDFSVVANAMLNEAAELVQMTMLEAGTLAGDLEKIRRALAGELQVKLPRAKERALQRGAAHLLGNTRPFYEFIRMDLGISFSTGHVEPGPQVEAVFNAILDGRIIGPLQASLQG